MKSPISKLVPVALFVLALVACKKEKPLTPAKATSTITAEQDKHLENRIISFYGQMKSLKGKKVNVYAKTTSNDTTTISVDSAQFLTQAAYNYYVARNSTESMTSCGFTFDEPLDINGEITADNVADAFWRVKDSLMVTYDSIAYANKKLASVVLNVQTTVDGRAVYTVVANITDGPGIDPSELETVDDNVVMKSTGSNANTVYSAIGLGTFSTLYLPQPFYNTVKYGKGQATIDPITKALVAGTTDLTKPDARTRMRQLGVMNTPCLNFAISVGQLVVNNWCFAMGSNVSLTLPAPYLGMPGVNQAAYVTTEVYCVSGTNNTINDVNGTYKQWFTIPLINAYASVVPNFVNPYISWGQPSGLAPVDFNVWSNGLPTQIFSSTNGSCRYLEMTNFVTVGHITNVQLPNNQFLPQF